MANETKQQPATPATKTQQPESARPSAAGSSSDRPQPPTGPAPAATGWLTQAEAYLTDRGWEKVGGNEWGAGVWRDPSGSMAQARPTEEVRLPAAGGGFETVHQIVGAVCPWDYLTEEAVRVQRGRDKGTKSDSPLDRIDILTKRHNDLENRFDRLLATVERVAASPSPAKVTDLMTHCQELKNKLARAADEARPRPERQPEAV